MATNHHGIDFNALPHETIGDMELFDQDWAPTNYPLPTPLDNAPTTAASSWTPAAHPNISSPFLNRAPFYNATVGSQYNFSFTDMPGSMPGSMSGSMSGSMPGSMPGSMTMSAPAGIPSHNYQTFFPSPPSLNGTMDPMMSGMNYAAPDFRYFAAANPNMLPPAPPLFTSNDLGFPVSGRSSTSPRRRHIRSRHSYTQQSRQSSSSAASPVSTPRSPSTDPDDPLNPASGPCPHEECAKYYKDLKSHLLTHKKQRPQRSPIPDCEYNLKGFARKYDRNRHTLTHFKGTLVCPFCPGSGSPAEKTFNRGDVFKKHLQTVHDVDQNATKSNKQKSRSRRKKHSKTTASAPVSASPSPAHIGVCSNCDNTFETAQELHDHVDQCIMELIQSVVPSEAINLLHLSGISDDSLVKETLEKHNLTGDEMADEDTQSDEEDDDSKPSKSNSKTEEESAGESRAGGIGGRRGRPGITLSRSGMRLNGPTTSGRKKRKNYPASWGSPAATMTMKKRVMCVFDGQRRLWKDDLMLDSDFEVRIPLRPNSGEHRRSYTTDLDVTTLQRADAIFGASEEERGPSRPDNVLYAEGDESYNY